MAKRLFLFIFCGFLLLLPLFLIANADELDDITKQLDSLKKDLQDKEANFQNLNKQLNNIRSRVTFVESEIVKKEEEVRIGEEALAFQRELLSERAKSYYKNINKNAISIVNLLTSENLSESLQGFFYQKTLVDQDRNTITRIVLYIKDLETKKEELKSEKSRLAVINAEIDRQAESLAGEITETRQKVADLSARQQELLSAKLASAPVPKLAVTSLGGCSSDIGKDPGFGNAFGFFSFGVPNKIGLNQYGARGRAVDGQSHEDILAAYYTNYQITDYDTGINIIVNGTNPYNQTFNNETYNIEDYVKRLYEMPTGDPWASNNLAALKAQAIAARSYALAATNNGQKSIVPNEYGQVIKKEFNTQNWIDAVDATRGKVMTYNGNPISAWYSSTHGGVVLTSAQIGWNSSAWTKNAIDAVSYGNINDFKNSAFDKSSPWFHCDWGYRSEYNNTAWLKEDEVVDIINAYILWELDNSTITYLSQTDQPSGDTWSANKVREEIQNRGGSSISSISSISVGWDGSGTSKTISVNGRNFDAQKFKNLFNIRAPANIQIKPACRPKTSELNCGMYALYNVERQ